MTIEKRATTDFYDGSTSLRRPQFYGEFESESAFTRQSSGRHCAPWSRIFMVTSGTSADVTASSVPGHRSAFEKSHSTRIYSCAYDTDAAVFAERRCAESLIGVRSFSERGFGEFAAGMYAYERLAPSISFIADIIFISDETAPFVERRQRGTLGAISERTHQIEKNMRAVALLNAWLVGDTESESESESLKQTIDSLNAERAPSRKLYP